MMGYYERHPGKLTKDALGPYVAWFVIALIGFWPEAVWRGAVGWVVTGLWLGLIVVPVTVLVLIGRKKAQRKQRR
jgi:hypothetical protein